MTLLKKTNPTFTKYQLEGALLEQYYSYYIVFKETPPSYSHGGLPEEGLWLCRDCQAEWLDGHVDYCTLAPEIDAVVTFIESL